MPSRTLAARGAVALLLVLPVAADTIVVDAAGGAGSHFTDIPPAVAAAQPGDVILVRVGAYSAFTLDRAVLVIGEGDAASWTASARAPAATVSGVPAGTVAGLVNLRLSGVGADLTVQGCEGTVVLEGLAGYLYGLGDIADSADVRLHGTSGTFRGGLRVIGSRAEIVAASIQGSLGADGQSGNPWWPATDGGVGLVVGSWATGDAARVHLVRSDVRGGDGGSMSIAGDGGPGLVVLPASQLVLAGFGASTVQGGSGGWGDQCGDDGNPGDGLVNDAGQVWRSGELLLPGTIEVGQCGYPAQGHVYIAGPGSLDEPVAPWDPTLTLSGSRTPGSVLQGSVQARDGALVLLAVGSTPARIDDGRSHVERLVGLSAFAVLGVVQSGNQLGFTYRVRTTAGLGETHWLQAWVRLPGGSLRRSNSVPVIVR